MRTTLSLDDDVAALIKKARKATKASLKEVINAGLREGLVKLTTPSTPRQKFQTHAVHLGRCYLPSLDNVGEILAVIEGEQYK